MNLQNYFEENKTRLLINSDYPKKMCKYLYDKFQMKKDEKLLDIGCGHGIQCNKFANLGLDVFGVDNIASPSFDNFKYCNVDLATNPLPFENNCFDYVFSKSVIEHIVDPDCFLNECKRVLKPGGMIIVMTPDWESQMQIFYDDPTHVHPYTKNSITTILNMSDFEKVESSLFTQLPIVWGNKLIEKVVNLINYVPYIIFKKFRKFKYVRFAREKMIIGTGFKSE